MMEPNGISMPDALETGEVIFVDCGVFLLRGFPKQVEAGEVRIMASPFDEVDDYIELVFPPDEWVKVRREVECR